MRMNRFNVAELVAASSLSHGHSQRQSSNFKLLVSISDLMAVFLIFILSDNKVNLFHCKWGYLDEKECDDFLSVSGPDFAT